MRSVKQQSAFYEASVDISRNPTTSNHESLSDLQQAFSHLIESLPKVNQADVALKTTWLDSPLGPILTIADAHHLYLLEPMQTKGLEREIKRLHEKTKSAIIPGMTTPIRLIEKELKLYFAGKLKAFETPFLMMGSDFQKRVWKALMKIPYGETCSYAELAKNVGIPTACRAVANANGKNQLAIMIPCHRVINANGGLGGYGGGLPRKQWLLNHEKKS